MHTKAVVEQALSLVLEGLAALLAAANITLPGNSELLSSATEPLRATLIPAADTA